MLLDGAHNPAGAAALAIALDDLRPFLGGGGEAPPTAVTLVHGSMADKDVAGNRRRAGRGGRPSWRDDHRDPGARCAGAGRGRGRRPLARDRLRGGPPTRFRTSHGALDRALEVAGRVGGPDRRGRIAVPRRRGAPAVAGRPTAAGPGGAIGMSDPARRERTVPAEDATTVVAARPELGGGSATPSFALPAGAPDGLPGPLGETRIGPQTFRWGERTFVMGILNVTPDSFSGDGLLPAVGSRTGARAGSMPPSLRPVRWPPRARICSTSAANRRARATPRSTRTRSRAVSCRSCVPSATRCRRCR